MNTEDKTPTKNSGLTRKDQKLAEALLQANRTLLNAMKSVNEESNDTFDSEELSQVENALNRSAKMYSRLNLPASPSDNDNLEKEFKDATRELLGLSADDDLSDVTVSVDEAFQTIDKVAEKKKAELSQNPGNFDKAMDLWILDLFKKALEDLPQIPELFM